jgi:hypothetical protein
MTESPFEKIFLQHNCQNRNARYLERFWTDTSLIYSLTSSSISYSLYYILLSEVNINMIKKKLKLLRSKLTGFYPDEFNAQNQYLLNETAKQILNKQIELEEGLNYSFYNLNEKIEKILTMQNKPEITNSNSYQITLDYPVNSIPRYGYDKKPHKMLYDIINQNRLAYINFINVILEYKNIFFNIAMNKQNEYDPHWINGWLPGLDTIALYSFLAKYKPKRYFEIGSGNSTKFAKYAIRTENLSTYILSIDPCPRTEIDKICNTVIRKPLEDVDLDVFNELESGDILFIDSSHRVFMNSDVTAIFLDLLPKLKQGVIVEFHDILLPSDYPYSWADRFYSEQYMLAEYLLLKNQPNKILFPCRFVFDDIELRDMLNPIFNERVLEGIERHGCSFWIEI